MSGVVTVGPHRLACGDVSDGVTDRLMGRELAGVIFSDPPWGPGNQKYWHTTTGTEPRGGWPEFLAAFCGAVARHREVGAPAFVETGPRWLGDLDAAMHAVGMERRARWTVTYGPRRAPLPAVLSLYTTPGVPVRPEVLAPVAEDYAPRATVEVLSRVVAQGTVVLDPCVGRGLVARATHALGGRVRGADLSAERLAVTEAWLRAALTGPPDRGTVLP